eukprot:gene19168-6464_t
MACSHRIVSSNLLSTWKKAADKGIMDEVLYYLKEDLKWRNMDLLAQ